MILRGYALPFDQLAAVSGEDGAEFERVFEGAFDDMLVRNKPVVLQFLSHDRVPAIAKTADRTLTLFSDQHGLGFEALTGDRLDIEGQIAIRQGNVSGASINFTKTLAEVGRCGTRYISQAEIDHITITSQPAYRQTAVWPFGANLERAPTRIWDAAARWEKGWAEFQAAKKRILANNTSRGPAGNGRRISNDCARNFDRVSSANARLIDSFSQAEQRAIVRNNPELWRDIAAPPASRPALSKRK